MSGAAGIFGPFRSRTGQPGDPAAPAVAGGRRRLTPVVLLALLVVSGCSRSVATYGIPPVDPPALKGLFGKGVRYVEVDSFQPVLRWEPFPGPRHLGTDNGVHRARIADVTYELRVAKAGGALPGIIYMRKGIIEPVHRIEEPLEPSTEYRWTVRARFLFGGEPRVSEWGATEPLAGRAVVVPNPASYRFRTPAR